MPVNLDFSRHPSADDERAVKLFISRSAHETLRAKAEETGHSMSFVADAAIRALTVNPLPDVPSEQDIKPDTKQDMDHDEDFLGDPRS